jgi:Ca2+-binding RTX toxin-like protein
VKTIMLGRALATALVAMALPAALGTTPAAAAQARCDGRLPTIVGTNGDDRLVGTRGPDVILGRAGDDVIDGRGGNDVICGGEGADVIHGGRGDDRLYGDHARLSSFLGDLLDGGPGDDLLDLSASAASEDVILTRLNTFSFASAVRGVRVDLARGTANGEGHDRLVPPTRRGTYVPDITVIGSRYDDVIRGGVGPDKLVGGRGDDRLVGRGGDDVLKGEALSSQRSRTMPPDDDVLDAGAGFDQLDSFVGHDRLSGGSRGDHIFVDNSSATQIDAGKGENILQVRLPRESGLVIDGGPTHTILSMDLDQPHGTALDAGFAFDQASATSTLTESDGTTYTGTLRNVSIFRFYLSDPITFVGGDESTGLFSYRAALDASMGGGNDRVHGSPNDDHLDGGDGNDRVWPSAGTDTCVNFEVGTCSTG